MTDDVKVKVESLLFLVDKFEVSDKFALEMTIVFENLPISYLVKESRHKIENNYIYIYTIPGSFQVRKEKRAFIQGKTCI